VEKTIMIKLPSILSPILLLLGVSAAWTNDLGEVAKLKARVEKLEAENAAIKRELAELKKTLAALQRKPKTLPQAAEAKLQKAVKDFFEDFDHGRLRSAYGSMSQAYQKRTKRAAFDAFMKMHKSLMLKAARGGFDAPRYKFRKLAKDNAFECDVVMPDEGGPSNMTVRLIEEEGAWKLDDFVELKERKKP
jgi:cell division protein FtsB